MASSTIQNPPAPAESKSARKKKAKAADRTDSPARAASTPEKAASAAGDHDDLSDSPYIRELQKNIRNINKKISNLAKTEAVINEHKEKSLDELVALKIINTDQKASHLKKPALQAQLAQLEEQLAQHKKIELEHRARLAEVEKSLADKFEKLKTSLVTEIKEQAAAEAKATLESNLLVLSQFLRLAAARRAEGEDTSDEGQALEGVLWHIYTGDESAVAAMLKLVGGSDEQTVTTNGDKLQTTFAKVKDLSVNYLTNFYAEAAAEEGETKESEPQPDPTVANAGLTEIEEGSAEALTNGHTAEPTAAETAAPSNADVADNAANAAGESQWDAGNDTANDLSMSQEWVEVKAPETEAVEAPSTKDSWADEHPETPASDPNDGFHPVQRNRGNREGGYRGRGERGGHRGRGGFRGDGRGRGRGRGGDRMPSRPRGNRGGNGNSAEAAASAQSEYR